MPLDHWSMMEVRLIGIQFVPSMDAKVQTMVGCPAPADELVRKVPLMELIDFVPPKSMTTDFKGQRSTGFPVGEEVW